VVALFQKSILTTRPSSQNKIQKNGRQLRVEVVEAMKWFDAAASAAKKAAADSQASMMKASLDTNFFNLDNLAEGKEEEQSTTATVTKDDTKKVPGVSTDGLDEAEENPSSNISSSAGAGIFNALQSQSNMSTLLGATGALQSMTEAGASVLSAASAPKKKATQKPKRVELVQGALGMAAQSFTKGMMVTKVVEGKQAFKLGVEKKDYIVGLNDCPLSELMDDPSDNKEFAKLLGNMQRPLILNLNQMAVEETPVVVSPSHTLEHVADEKIDHQISSSELDTQNGVSEDNDDDDSGASVTVRKTAAAETTVTSGSTCMHSNDLISQEKELKLREESLQVQASRC
jgi:hypothetical protein